MESVMNDKAEIEQLKEQEEVKTALKQTTGTKETVPKPSAKLGDKLWFGTYILALLGLIALYYLFGAEIFSAQAQYVLLFRRLLIGSILIVLVMAIAKGVRVYLINQIENRPAQYNLSRVLNLVVVLLITVI